MVRCISKRKRQVAGGVVDALLLPSETRAPGAASCESGRESAEFFSRGRSRWRPSLSSAGAVRDATKPDTTVGVYVLTPKKKLTNLVPKKTKVKSCPRQK